MKFPYTKARKGQLEVIKRIKKNLGKKIFLKAPTGFGKTIVALLSHSDVDKVLYAVRTRNEMSPVIRELKRINENYAFIFSAARMCPLGQSQGSNTHEFWLNCKLLRSRGLCPHFMRLSKVTDDELRQLIQKSVTNDPHEITSLISTNLGVCPFFALSRLAHESRFVIVTYPYVFRNEVFETAFDPAIRDEMYVILDEAHTVFNPQLVIDEEIDNFIVEKAINEVKLYGLRNEVRSYLVTLKQLLSEVKATLLRKIDKELVYPGLHTLMVLEDALLELRIKKLRKASSISDIVLSGSSLGKIVKFLKYLSRNEFQVYAQVTRNGSRVLKVLTPDISYVKEMLESFRGVLMMSGTLPHEDIARQVLFSDAEYIDIEQDYGAIFPESNTYCAVFTGVTSSYRHRSEDTYQSYSMLIEKTVASMESGVALIVYPSYKFMENVLNYLVLESVAQVVEGYGTTLKDMVSQITTNKSVIHAVAGGKLTEGLELLDDKGRSVIKLVLVAGVPYPQPDDFIRDFRANLRRLVGELIAKEFVMNVQAGIKVAQAIGRAVRSERDRAFVVLADRRYLSIKLKNALGLRYDLVTGEVMELIDYFQKFLHGYL